MDCPRATVFVRFFERELADAALVEFEAHLGGCGRCRNTVADLAAVHSGAAATEPVTAGAAPDVRPLLGGRIGRYVILDLLGVGGMGAVYAAFDPELDRKVAVKLLRREAAGSDDDQARLRREAQSLARVSHPGVVAVHDVGEHGDRVFIAMELIAGGTLRSWAAERPRPWPDVVRVAIEAGRALAAAHEVGLIHRDVKPDNILIDAAGRARVGDFGLARAIESGDPDELAGTPAYMAPEQKDGRAVTPRSDQYSFCVTVSEVFGEGDVPARVRAVVARGMAAAADERWASMDELLGALTRASQPRRTWRWAALAGVLAAAGLAVVLARGDASAAAVCSGAADELAEVWDREHRARVTRAFAATGKPYAADTAARVGRMLDDQVARWTDAHTRTCKATRVHRSQTEAVMQARMTCLTQRRRDLGALVEVLAGADAAVVEKAIAATAALESIESCETAVPDGAPPLDPTRQAEADRLADRVAEARARLRAGKVREALALATAAAADTRKLDVPALHAEAMLVLAAAQDGGEVAVVEASLNEAVWAAERAGDAPRRARAWIELIDLAEPARAATLVGHATAVLSHVPADDDLHTRLLMVQANDAQRAGRFDEAFALYRRAADQRSARFGAGSLELAPVLSAWGAGLVEHGDFAAALEVMQRAHAVSQQALGDDHPETAKRASNVAHCLMSLGRPAEARELSARTLTVFTAAYGERSEFVGVALTNLTEQSRALGELDQAVAYGQRTLATYRAIADDLGVARALANLGLIERQRGQLDEAARLHLEALAIADAKLADRKPMLAALLNMASGTLLAAQRYPEALALSRRSLALAEETLGKDNGQLVYPLLRLGEILANVDQPREARTHLERAMKLVEPTTDPEALRHLRFELGRAIGASGGPRARAVELVTQARADAAAAKDDVLAAAADAWLKR